MGSVLVSPLIGTLCMLVLLSISIVDGGVVIPTTLDGPFKPVTVPLDKSFRGKAVDMPDTDPLVQRNVEGFEPEQISLSLSASHSSVWVSWITGEFQIGENIEPLDPATVGSIVQYGRFGRSLTRQAVGSSLVYSQLYPFEGLQNYTSGIIHHVRLTGLKPNTLYQYKCGDPSLAAMSDVHYFRTMPVSGPKSYPSRIAVVGDLGLTYNTTSTVDHMASNHPDLILLVGDASYANLYLTNGSSSDCYSCSFNNTPIHETYQPRWDYWGRYMEPLISSVPIMVVEGNHEIEQQAENKTFVAYSSRFAFPSEESGSSSTFYYSFNAGGIHFIMLPELLATIPVVAALDSFQRIIVLRCLRPDKVIPAVMSFVATEMGQRFIEPQPFDLKAGFDDSNCSTPLIFVLTPGADPMSELLKLAAELGFNKKFVAISLGQGQGPLAENAIAEAIDNGTWVCLQNCHLSVSWLPTLEKICEEITPDRVHASFRLWLTSEPTRAFPSYILQHGVKMTNEPPKGMRANLKGSYLTIDEQWVASCKRPKEFKKLLFGLCFFHAVVRERTKFGPLGWNISYVFSSSDLAISKDQLKISLDDLQPTDPIPYAALAYLAGECNYGGRVTDDKDRRCLITILSDFYTRDILSDSYTFSPSGLYYAPSADTSLSVFLNYIDQLPMNEGPEVFGLHDNANISTAIAETNLLLESALSLQPRGASGGGAAKSWDEVLDETARDIAAKLPPLFDIEKAELAFPVSYSESMNTVLTQELGRFNRLLNLLHISLVEIQKAIKGLVVMSAELEAMGNSMVNGHVPARWSAVAYPSLKPLGSWVTDFLARLAFLQNWLNRGVAPPVYWISGFFFTQAFITGTQQNYARKHKLPIDQVGYDMVVLAQAASELTLPAEDGAYVDGLFLEGARWDAIAHTLAESNPRELYVPLPVLHLLPKARDQIEPIEDTDPKGTAHVYLCPVYKTSKRQGTLSTTGHSTNFVMSVRLPMSEQHRQKHWIRRGVALLTQLDT